MVTFAFILGLPMLNSTVAFSAVVSISTIGLYISCAFPTSVPGMLACLLGHQQLAGLQNTSLH